MDPVLLEVEASTKGNKSKVKINAFRHFNSSSTHEKKTLPLIYTQK